MTKLTTLGIARRIVSRAKTLAMVSYVPGPIGDGGDGFIVRIGIEGGRRFDVTITPILGERDMPVGFTHITGSRKPTDQLDLAERISRWVLSLADVDHRVDRMEPWHKDGVASLEVHSACSIRRFLIEVQEWTPDMDIAAARPLTQETTDKEG